MLPEEVIANSIFVYSTCISQYQKVRAFYMSTRKPRDILISHYIAGKILGLMSPDMNHSLSEQSKDHEAKIRKVTLTYGRKFLQQTIK